MIEVKSVVILTLVQAPPPASSAFQPSPFLSVKQGHRDRIADG